MYIYVYIRHTHTHTYIYIYTYTHIRKYICMYLYINIIHECLTCIYIHMCRIFVRTYGYITGLEHAVVLLALYAYKIYAYTYMHTYQRRLANAARPAEHTLVFLFLSVFEPVAHAFFQLGPALEPLRSTDIEHTHFNNPVSVPQSSRRLEGTRVFRMPPPCRRPRNVFIKSAFS